MGEKNMKMTIKEHESHQKCKTKFIIDFINPSGGKGHIEVKSSFYDKYIKKFSKAMKDVVILSFMEVDA